MMVAARAVALAVIVPETVEMVAFVVLEGDCFHSPEHLGRFPTPKGDSFFVDLIL